MRPCARRWSATPSRSPISSRNSMTRRACPARRSICTSRTDVVPVALLHNLKHNKVIHRTDRPAQCGDGAGPADRSREDGCESADLPDDFHAMTRALWFHGAAQHPARAGTPARRRRRCTFNMMDTSFFVGRLTHHAHRALRMVAHQDEPVQVHASQRLVGDGILPNSAGARRRTRRPARSLIRSSSGFDFFTIP